MKNKTILIVEDDQFLREMYKVKLELEGFKIITAEDGEKALKLIKTKAVDLVLLDIIMPKVDGFGVLEGMQNTDGKLDVPVVLLTNLSQKEEVDKGFKLGAKDYMIKAHFVPSEVVTKIKTLLK